MRDDYGREIDYLRISITDRCNLRCVYCMPEEGVQQIAHEEILSYDEILSICKAANELGIRKFKLTGGEPLTRKNLMYLIRKLKAFSDTEAVTLTTNAILLKDCIDELVDAGLDGINISLDTLNKERYIELTRRDMLDKTLEGINAAIASGINVKINCVPIGETEDIIQLAELAKENNVHVRFIEMMPIGEGINFDFTSEEDILSILKDNFGEYQKTTSVTGNGPAHYYSFEGFKGKIGFISALSHKFCNECNRIRLTSEGFLKSCLQYNCGMDLKSLLRSEHTKEDLKEAINKVISEKPMCHNFDDKEYFDSREDRKMSQIGG